MVPDALLSGNLPLPALTLAEGFFLVSPWKPVLLLIPFVPWAMIVSRVLDKHAARFFLAREAWNVGHLCVGLLAFIVAISIPVKEEWAFWLGLVLMILILVGDIVVFAMVTNKDERVPEAHQLTLDFSRWTEARAAKAAAKKAGTVQLVIKSPDKSLVPAPDGATPEFEVRVAAEQMMCKTLDARASEVVLAPTGKDNTYTISMLVDGVRQPGAAMPASEALKILNFWKAAGKLDVADQRKKQQADIGVERDDSRKKIRMTTIGTQAGPRLVMLIDPEAQVKRKPDHLGLLEPQMKELQTLVTDGQGVVVLAGAPDSGRTTTMYTVVKMHDAYTKNVQTVELEPQDSLEGVRQNKWDAQAEGPEFSTLVRSIIRRDPDVVAVAEVPDAATAKELAKAESDRTRVYASLRADNALQALQMWVKLVGDADQASKCLHGVVAQKVLRKLCTNCRVAYQPGAEMLKKMGLPGDKVKQLFKKGGQVLIKNKPEVCPVCGGGGYIGQEGVFEVFSIGEGERAMVKSGDWNALRGEFRKKTLPTIQQSALRKAVDGVTSLEEVLRITADPAKAGDSKPASEPKTSGAGA
ncbi:MAG: Flp pilus assembly complex ATPase component TadA [Planctomycetes bacterium]|nr:Flp pilus assembly complex ATPase component TadA [Planctomycetota bacterium]